MKILYGIQTTGNGHICRSREVIRELKNRQHEIHVLFSGPKPSMQSEFKEFYTYQIFRGLTFCTHRGNLKYFKTAFKLNFFQFYRDIISFDEFGYDLVISDFEPISARIARRKSLPSIGLGHQYAFVHKIPIGGGNPLARFVMNNFAPVDYPVGLHWHHFNQPILPPIVPNKIESKHEKIDNMILVKPLAGQMEQLSNAPAIATLKLGMVMIRLNNARVAQFLDQPAVTPIKFPNVARMVADWIESGQWEDVEGLAKKAWQQTWVPV